MKGKRCPQCTKQKLQPKGSVRRCSKCKFIGWELVRPVKGLPASPALKCPMCSHRELVEVYVNSRFRIFRCGVCYFAGVFRGASNLADTYAKPTGA
jgi:Zn ribbon nucleic-acid-binding protein